MSEPLLTAEEYAERKFDLPDGGRWTELERGAIIQLQPPSEAHGTVVFNLSRALGQYFGPEQQTPGYACFELGLRVSRRPDTVRSPAACCFVGAERFAESDKIFTDTRPVLVAEIASTNDRRRGMAQRVEEYRRWKVERLWIIDPVAEQVHVYAPGGEPQVLGLRQTLEGDPVLPGFALPVSQLFAEPGWWRGR